MKLLQICLGNFYIDNYSYQENILPKYQKEFIDEIKIIASLVSFDKDGKVCLLPETNSYVNENGIPVVRIEYKKKSPKISRIFRIYEQDLYSMIEKEQPDIIFIHGFHFWDIRKVVKYARRNPSVIIYADSHADFENSASNWLSKNILHKIIWKYCAKIIEPYTKKFYGVLPARVDFLTEVYGLPKEKVELLVMGADDGKVEEAKKPKIKKEIREKYNISDDEFLIITGGKIDHNKPETLDLMKAVTETDRNVKLMVFGSVVPELKEEFEKLLKDEKIIYIGWVNSTEIYKYFAASDLAFFPGKHSVLWEQAVGTGVPCVFREMEGFKHVDIGGNCVFLKEITVNTMKECVEKITSDTRVYEEMKRNATEKGMKAFSYREIAKKSIS